MPIGSPIHFAERKRPKTPYRRIGRVHSRNARLWNEEQGAGHPRQKN
jgi:hypothetical protein